MARRGWLVAFGFLAAGTLGVELGGCTTLLGDFDVSATATGDGGGADGPAAKSNGVACGAATDCASGFCADGVCCDTACSGTCEACNLGTPGTCAPVPDGVDPANECLPADAGTSPPASDAGDRDGGVALNVPDGGLVSNDVACKGACDGRRACKFPGEETSCGTRFCNDTTTAAGYACNGRGVCDLSVRACQAYACEADTCRKSCAAVDDCQSTHFCNPQGQCQQKLGNGVQCVNAGQCANGFCVDGVCCNSSCNDFGGTCANPGALGQCKCSRDCGAGSCVLWFVDADRDGFGDRNAAYTGPAGTGAIIGCSNQTPPTGYAANKLDCADENATARPGQTAFFTTPIPGTSPPSYDWNCDGALTKERPEFPRASCTFCGPPKDCTPLPPEKGCAGALQQSFLSCAPAKNSCVGLGCEDISCGGPTRNDYRDGFVETVACGASAKYVTCGACLLKGGQPGKGTEAVETQGCR